MADKHVHKYRRHIYKTGNAVYFCALPDCNHKINVSLSLGKRSVCWRCEEPFIMNEYAIRLAKPHCQNCHKPKVINEEVVNVEAISIPISMNDSLSVLRNRLSGATHQGNDEGDI